MFAAGPVAVAAVVAAIVVAVSVAAFSQKDWLSCFEVEID